MDVLFQIFLPTQNQVAGLEPHQETFSWGGEEHPQAPVVYRWGEHIRLVPQGIQDYIRKFLPEDYLGPGWVFFYTSRRYLATGEARDMLAGNAPIIVERGNGSLHVLGTALPFEEYVKEYERLRRK